MSNSEEVINSSVANLLKERTNLRRTFTAACNQLPKIDENVKIDSKAIRITYNKVLDKADRLFNIDAQLNSLIEISDEDFDTIESYRDRFIEVKTIYEKYVIEDEDNNSSFASRSSGINLKLPKLNLKEYDLMPRTWVAFWGQFSRIHEDPNLKEEDKFQYLLSSLKPKTKAREIADSYPPSKDNYAKVMEHIKSRFGRDDLLIEVYIRDLLAMVSKSNTFKLSTLYDQLGTYLRALETLGVTTDKYAAMLYPVVESCLPSDILKAWDRHRLNKDSDSSRYLIKEKLLEELMTFLRNEVEGEEHRTLAESGFIKNKKPLSDVPPNDIPSASTLTSSSKFMKGKFNCLFCERNHNSQDCVEISQMPLEDKKAAVIKKKACLVCLRIGHMAKTCRSSVKCIFCNRRHYALLCPELSKKSKHNNEEKNSTLSSMEIPSNVIYLKTIMVKIRNKGKAKYVRALLDDGSHRSYIEESLAKELDLPLVGKELLSQGLFGGGETAEAIHGCYNIRIENISNQFSCQISVLDQPKICTNLPRVKDQNLIIELSKHGIKLSDIGPNEPPIRMLIGADMLSKILTGKVEVMKSGIVAIETKFGWSVLGTKNRKTAINIVTLTLQNFELPKLWELETLGIMDPVEKKGKGQLEKETIAHFKETIKINANLRYEVSLPWIDGHPSLSNHYDIAKSRLYSVTKRLKKEGLFEDYDKIFQQWEHEGIIETVKNTEISSGCHYLPHRPVLKPSSTTTKIRPVFDASVKYPGSTSLNDCLSIGPNLSQQILPLLMNFRLRAKGVIADIRQAFLQLSLNPFDRDFLRFLWWEEDDHPKMKTYRHCRVVFGITSSPFLLNATLMHHLDSEKYHNEEFKETINTLKGGFYVDNLVTSVNNELEVQNLITQSKSILSEGQFDLRCWAYNGVEEENQMVLGLKWNTSTDELCCVGPVNKCDDQSFTKRTLLSIINGVYDPIGFTCPALLLPKLLLQEAWRSKLSWDETLPNDIQKRLQKWMKGSHLIEQCSIPRRMFHGDCELATLHIFTDASAYAYSCCAFLRCENGAKVHVQLVAAKARVAPMKVLTIPRMELLGAAIGARMSVSIIESLKLPIKTFYWTDSMVVLSWITKKEPWNTFVGNRVKEIRQITDIKNWKHVPGELNPADLPSRSCDWFDLLHKKWWEGPSWLQHSSCFWPQNEITLPDEALLERKKIVSAAVNVDKDVFSDRLSYFSKYSKLVRMIAWIFRFIHNCQKKHDRITAAFTFEEIDRAEKSLIKLVQTERASEIKEKYSRSIRFYEQDGILRIKTKLILGDDSEEFQRPIVLPDHSIVRRYIEHVHYLNQHCGVQVTLNILRERYWIPRGRRVIREVLKSCIVCKRYSSQSVVPESPPLPKNRINRVAAFQVTGADLAGPVHLKNGLKAWIVLFTCAVYRAVHLELVTSLSTEAFMQALRRFFARRGRSSIMYTDNGTNFTGAARALDGLDWNAIQDECSLLKIKWYFSPPSAPWYGGWWERMVRCVKELLRKVLRRACVTYEEMNTLLCDCESTINGRPITYLSDDPNELRPLTPSHFIQDLRVQDTIDLDEIDSKHLLKRVQYLQTLRQNLRKRFQKEYLSELVKSPFLTTKRKDLVPGDVVLIGSDNAKRINWPLARVVQLFPGKDNVSRVAKLKTAKGEIIRPLQRIYPLEIRRDELDKDLQEEPVAQMEKETSEPDKGSESVFLKTRRGRLVKPPARLNL